MSRSKVEKDHGKVSTSRNQIREMWLININHVKPGKFKEVYFLNSQSAQHSSLEGHDNVMGI